MMHSPLRYPGGKSDFLATAIEIFVGAGFEGTPVVEPYAGSAAVSLGLLDFGLTPNVLLVERDPILYAFWNAVFEKTDELITAFQETPITLESWRKLQPLLQIEKPTKSRIVEMGLAALFFNRANFSGILNAGPIGGKEQRSKYKIDCRTNKDEIISRLLALAMLADKVDTKFDDAINVIKNSGKVKNRFFYLDPPYFDKGELLYRYFYGVREHKELSKALMSAKSPWLLSYDDHHVIEFLYAESYVSRMAFRYSARSPKNHQELLISSFPLPMTDTHLREPARRARSNSLNISISRVHSPLR